MPIINCPHCDQPLTVTDDAPGRPAQCPVCSHSFVISGPEGHAAETPTGSPFVVTDEERVGAVRVQTTLEDPATWLRRTFVCDALTGFSWCVIYLVRVGAMPEGEERLPVVLLLAVVNLMLYLPLVFLLLGATALSRRRWRGLALIGGIMALIVALRLLVQVAWLGLPFLPTFGKSSVDLCFGILLVFWSLLAGLGAACGITGAIKTFLVLTNPDLRSAFR